MAGKFSSDIVYKVQNPYTSDERDISDVPHLIKTVRNAHLATIKLEHCGKEL